MNVTTVGIDLAKHSFSLHGVDSRGQVVFKKTLSRTKLLPLFGSMPPCLVGMEACSGAHYWGRELQAILSLSEFGLIMPKGRYSAQHRIPDILEDAENGLPMLARKLLHDTYLRLRTLNEQILAYDRELNHLVRDSEPAKRLMTVPGIGAITATALLASVGDPRQFRNGRQFAAWLGLTPRQYTPGGKTRLGRITKKGDAYLRTLLIHGTRAVLSTVKDKDDKLSCWAKTLIERRGYKRAAVALAAKNARILWALMVKRETYQPRTAA